MEEGMNGLAQTNTAEITSETEDNVTINVSKNSNSTVVKLTLFDSLSNMINEIALVNGKASLSLTPVEEDKVFRIAIQIGGVGNSAILTINVKSNIDQKIYKKHIKVSEGVTPPQAVKRLRFVIEASNTTSQTGAV